MKEIQLTMGKIAVVDEEDYELLSQYKWHTCKAAKRDVWYAITNIKTENGIRRISMHRFIMKVEERGSIVDHKDGDGLNNIKNNLRCCTPSQNNANRKISRTKTTSKYLGVYHRRKTNKCIASIRVKGKSYYLGTFKDEISAAKAYDAAAKIHHGEFANLNFKSNPIVKRSDTREDFGNKYWNELIEIALKLKIN